MSLAVTESDAIPAAWWQEMSNRACIMDFTLDERTVSVTAEFESSLDGATGAIALRFRISPVTANASHTSGSPGEACLLSIVGGSSCAFVVRIIEFGTEFIVVDAQPVSSTQRPLRRFARTPYPLGPCTAVVHSAVRQWRGLVEFWVHDVSTHGVGFAVAAGHADRVAVGDYLRAPITLPNGQRSWIDGEVIWLTSDGRGGLRTRRAPEWQVDTTEPATFAMTSIPLPPDELIM